MEYLQQENRFYIPGEPGSDDLAEITFTRIGDDRASIDHTYVNINYRGQGIADRLFDLVIEKMRQENRKVIPVCSYAVKKFEQKPHLQSMLSK